MVQEENHSSSHFSQRTEDFADYLRVSLRDLPERIGISDRMFYGYRSGAYPVSAKAWRKLRRAELAAGLQDALAAASPRVRDDPADVPPPGRRVSLAARLDRIEALLTAILEQLRER